MSDLDPQQVSSRATGHFQSCFPPRRPVSRPVFAFKARRGWTGRVRAQKYYLCHSTDTHTRGLYTPFVVYHEGIKRELKRRPTYECRWDERLKTKVERSTRLAYTGLIGGLEHLKIETRLIDERFASVMGECVFLK